MIVTAFLGYVLPFGQMVRDSSYFFLSETDVSFLYTYAVAELGRGESPILNIASLSTVSEDPKHLGTPVYQTVLLMAKAKLPEDHFPLSSPKGISCRCNEANESLVPLTFGGTKQKDITSYTRSIIKGKSDQPKRSLGESI